MCCYPFFKKIFICYCLWEQVLVLPLFLYTFYDIVLLKSDADLGAKEKII